MSPSTAPTVSISLTCKSASDALDFYTKAFGATELFRMGGPDGSVAHAEFMLGTSHLFISGESPEYHAQAMPEGTLAACSFTIASDDCDASFARALSAGATSLLEPRDQFWGKRTALVKDPFGYRWSFSQHLEDISPQEMMERAQALLGASK
jgi:PhnB protein